ncbi:MAG: hypothetical protein M3P82_05910, partial [Bacteroidota bacterium]|nr:hypothetical protein [Bacteroidota bacterium]
MDSANNLYSVGNKYNSATNSIDILIEKYDSSGNQLIFQFIPSNAGIDRGIDLAVDNHNNIYLTGYFFNSQTNSNDIITLALDRYGNTRWQKVLNNSGDDKGMGISVKLDQLGNASEVYITGYITSEFTGKDFFVTKFNALNGDSIWQQTYSAGRYDDIATDILIDPGHAYVIGYSYQGAQRLNDIMFQSYDLISGYLDETIVDNRPGSDEKPTAFVITEISANAVQKSRVSLTGVSESFVIGIQRRFLTMFLDPGTENSFKIRWFKYFSNCSFCRSDMATSISTDISGDVYVSGYVYNFDNFFQSNGLDFATIK